MAGISMVKIIGNAMGSVDTVKLSLMNISGAFTRFAEVMDKITFWN